MAPINVGALAYEYQAIDVVGPLDLLSSGSKLVTQFVREYAPIDDEVYEKAPEFAFHHIDITLDPVQLTAGVAIVPTSIIENAPELDILLLGGPVPHTFELEPKFAEYIRKHVSAGKVLWTNCTGAIVAAQAGVLDGKNATVNNVEYEWIKKRFPAVKWTRETKWVVDGNIWTASGAVAGMDMVAQWLRDSHGTDVLTLATVGLEYEPRNIDGMLDVLPKRYDASGKQISTHFYHYYDSY